jgi:hypothetical protein
MARWTSKHEQHDRKLFIQIGNNGHCYGGGCAVTGASGQRHARYEALNGDKNTAIVSCRASESIVGALIALKFSRCM